METPALLASLVLLLSGISNSMSGSTVHPTMHTVAPLPRDASVLNRFLYALLRTFLTTSNIATAIAHVNTILSASSFTESAPDMSLRLSDLDPSGSPHSSPRLWSLRIEDCLFENVSLRAASPDVRLEPGQSTITAEIYITGIITVALSLRIEVAGAVFDLKATITLRSFQGHAEIILGASADNVFYSHGTGIDASLYDIAETAEYYSLKDILPCMAVPACEFFIQAFEPPDLDVTLVLDPNHPVLAVAARALFIKQAAELLIRWNLRRLLRSLRIRLGN